MRLRRLIASQESKGERRGYASLFRESLSHGRVPGPGAAGWSVATGLCHYAVLLPLVGALTHSAHRTRKGLGVDLAMQEYRALKAILAGKVRSVQGRTWHRPVSVVPNAVRRQVARDRDAANVEKACLLGAAAAGVIVTACVSLMLLGGCDVVSAAMYSLAFGWFAFVGVGCVASTYLNQ
jgi:hypothetical protein